ncbi:MAG TPA: CoA transferase [Caulobacteraceae bacterium]|jgi:crotonobetainyl-CoA:carnitine CoA-transferase CaiB-like acyl-CoA transferase
MSAYAGVKVLDCSQGLAGPMAGMLFADFGAEVLKVEPPGGDRFAARPGYQMWNRGKRRTTLDVDAADGRARLEALIGGADVAIFDYSPRRMAALDLMGAADRHPRLVSLWMPPYGTAGEWSELEAHHAVLTALTGGAWRQSSYEYQPVYLVAPFLHYAQANMAAGAAGAALYERGRSGLGQSVTVSGFNAVALVGGASGNILPPGRKPLGASPSYRTYECGDGQFLFLATLFSYFFQRAVNAMGLTVALAEDVFPEDVTLLMEARFREKPRDEWLEILRAADVPCGPVSLREAWLGSDLIANNDMRLVLEDPERGPVEMPGAPIKLSKTPATVQELVRDAAPAEVEAFAQPPAAPPAPATAPLRAGPLAGIRVLDLGTVIAGAYASAILSNLGAEVVKVESADGDPWRDRGVGFTAYNRGKRGLVVDLKQPAGREVFLDLVRQADVVLDNYRLGVRDRLGVGHREVTAANPRAISASITTYGSRGAETSRPGFDPLLQARSGMMAAQGGMGPGVSGVEPVFHVMAVNDFASACTTAYGVIAALNARERTGEGQVLDTSLTCQSAMFQSGELTSWPGAPPAPKGSRDCVGVAALDRFYACADHWMLIAARHRADAEALAAALGHPDWASRFDMLAEPRDGALAAEIEAVLAQLPLAEAMAALAAAGVRATPAHDGDEVLNDPFLRANDFFDTVRQTPDGPVVNRPYGRFSRSHTGYTRPEPGLGEHTFEVLADWGIDAERIAALADEGVVMCLS